MAEFSNLITLVQISDGAQGPQGPQGESSDSYRLETNTEEVLQFNNGGVYTCSPTEVIITLFKADGQKIFSSIPTIKYYDPALTYEDTPKVEEKYTFLNNDNKEAVFSVQSFLTEKSKTTVYESLIFEISYRDEENIQLTKRFIFRNGLSKEMLDFSVNATQISAAMRDSKLEFGEEGLTITGTNFRIKDDQGQTNLEADNNGNLILKNIIAKSGTIGKFTISENSLISENGALQLFGDLGKIIANDIELGNSAKVQDSITFLGDNNVKAFLYNPAQHLGKLLVGGIGEGNSFIEKLAIMANGDARFGNIYINSNESIIQGKYNDSYDSLTCWELTPTQALFNNIVASGSIETAIFKKAYTQAVGGTMIFKPSYKILDIQYINRKIYIEGEFEGLKNSKIWLAPGSGNYTSATISSIEFTSDKNYSTITIEEDIDEKEYKYVIDLGRMRGYYLITKEEKARPWPNKKYYVFINEEYVESRIYDVYYKKVGEDYIEITDDERYRPNLNETYYIFTGEDYQSVTLYENYYEQDPGQTIIGINASNSRVGENHILPRGLTIAEYNRGSSSRPALFLGDLTSIGLSGYGLYSNNVYLTGALTTTYLAGDQSKYAGINTLNGVSANFSIAEHGFDDTSPVVIWAGADGKRDIDILEANFFVTSDGTAKMKRAYITDSSFYDGEIRGADIYAARIHGTGDSGALSIYDTEGGIKFFTGYEDEDNEGVETCRINSSGFSTSRSDVSIRFNSGRSSLALSQEGLFFNAIPTKNNPDTQTRVTTGMKVANNQIAFKFNETSYVTLSNNETRIDNQMILGNKLKYTYTNDGCDLYVIEEEVIK